MAAFESADRGAARGDGLLELYVRQLLRDADRMRRSTQLRTRPDTGVQVDRRIQTDSPRHGSENEPRSQTSG